MSQIKVFFQTKSHSIEKLYMPIYFISSGIIARLEQNPNESFEFTSVKADLLSMPTYKTSFVVAAHLAYSISTFSIRQESGLLTHL